jgi:hypothetical protein
LTGMQRHLQQMPGDMLVGATFSKVPAHYPDPGNPGHYMNVFQFHNQRGSECSHLFLKQSAKFKPSGIVPCMAVYGNVWSG